MVIGILKERFEDEQRVALTPFGVETLVKKGATVLIESGAGDHARFSDEQYTRSGAQIVYTSDEALQRAELVLKVMPPLKEEYEKLSEGQTLMSFLLFGMGRRPFVEYMLRNKVNSIGLELIKTKDHTYPILRLMSEISGQLSALVASRHLRSDAGGRGVLLGGIAGVAPAAVVILGAGTVGFAAARTIIGLGGQVILLDNDLEQLRRADLYFHKQITTVLANPENLRRGVRIADVLIGAISINDEESHHLITEDMVKTMKPGAVIIDVSINQGGCLETIHPTTVRDPIFVKHGVIHYAVPNMPSLVSRSSTYALTNGILPYIHEFMMNRLEYAETNKNCLHCGVATFEGRATHKMLEDMYGIPAEPLKCCL